MSAKPKNSPKTKGSKRVVTTTPTTMPKKKRKGGY